MERAEVSSPCANVIIYSGDSIVPAAFHNVVWLQQTHLLRLLALQVIGK